MADDRLRELERRWLQSNSPTDEAAWVSEALRAGQLTSERLKLAALLGYPAAVQVFGETSDGFDLVGWCARDVGRAGVTRCWAALAWIIYNVGVHRIDNYGALPHLPHETAEVLANPAAHGIDAADPMLGPLLCVSAAFAALRDEPHILAETVGRIAALVGGVDGFREAVAREVVPWALARGDPLRRRYEERRDNGAS